MAGNGFCFARYDEIDYAIRVRRPCAPVLPWLWFVLWLLILLLRGEEPLWSVAEQGFLPPRRRIYPRSSPRHRYRFDTPPGASGRPATGAGARRCTSVDIGALQGLAVLLAADSQPDGSPMLQAQHDSLLPEGGADENPVEPVPGNPAVVVSVEANNAAMGTTAVGGAPANDSVAGSDAEGTIRTGVGFPIDAGGRR
jgi:hypothetical protein